MPWTADAGGAGNRRRGVASRWNEKGFTFIKPDDGSEEVFAHSSGIKDGNCIREGYVDVRFLAAPLDWHIPLSLSSVGDVSAQVEFDWTMDERKGKPRAENITGGYYENRSERRGAIPHALQPRFLWRVFIRRVCSYSPC
jgi:cold shock CspA family protein